MKVYRKRNRNQEDIDKMDDACDYDGGEDGFPIGRVLGGIVLIAMVIGGIYAVSYANVHSASPPIPTTTTVTILHPNYSNPAAPNFNPHCYPPWNSTAYPFQWQCGVHE